MKPDKLLTEGLRKLGIEPSEKQSSMFMVYLEELKRWSRAQSLTSLETDYDIVVKHFLDSCLFLKVLPLDVHSIGDAGSGAGFPGLPIKIIRPDIEVYLIESSSKKCSFLRHMKRTLKLEGIEVVESRLEDVEGISADVAVTRALFKIGEFVGKAGHIVRKGGVFILNKGPKVKEELSEISFEHKVVPVRLPISDIERNLVIVRKEQ